MPNNQSFGRVLAYHACEQELADRVLANQEELRPSTNRYDWLGSGIYFWVDSKDRATDWAIELMMRGQLKEPCVLGAIIDLGHCLVLYEEESLKEVKEAYDKLKSLSDRLRLKLPSNELHEHGVNLLHFLDCAVINAVHDLREERSKKEYDSVIGLFEEGDILFPESNLRHKTHIQVALRNPDCIVACFNPKEHS